MKFSKNQIKWASQHDWFVSGNESQIVCRSEYFQSGKVTIETVVHTDFQTLRDWAGY